jgi:hypothetical protein
VAELAGLDMETGSIGLFVTYQLSPPPPLVAHLSGGVRFIPCICYGASSLESVQVYLDAAAQIGSTKTCSCRTCDEIAVQFITLLQQFAVRARKPFPDWRQLFGTVIM